MARLSFDETSGFMEIWDSYEFKGVISELGGMWDPDKRVWRIIFTIENLEKLLNAIPSLSVPQDLPERTQSQADKELKLERLRVISKNDEEVSVRVPGLNGKLYNYQKLGVTYAATNGVGLLLADSMGLGKGQVVGTNVYTPTGMVPVEQLKMGDLIIGRNGGSIKVTGVFHKPIQDIFRVTFNDGFHLDVDGDHLWYVKSGTHLYTNHHGVVLSMNQLMDKNGFTLRNGSGLNSCKTYKQSTYFKKANGNSSWSIPLTETIQFVPQPVPIDPYLLGVFLGDSSINKRGKVLIGLLKEDAKEMLSGSIGRPHKSKKPHMDVRYYNEYAVELCGLGLNGKRSWEKTIPKEYRYNSADVRLAVLQGLMDTDGHASNCSTEYSTSSKQLCDDVVEIVQTLGGIARVRDRIPHYWYKGVKRDGRKNYRVNIKLPPSMIPFRLTRKVANYDIPNKYLPGRYIVNIEKLPEQKASVCISVGAPDHLYVAEHCIVTHNTVQGIAASLLLKKSKEDKVLIIVPASLKYNWPIEIEKFTSEKYVVIDGTSEERVSQWLRDDVFFYIVNYELVVEDLFGGRHYKEKSGETSEQKEKREKIVARAKQRQGILSHIKSRVWKAIVIDEAQLVKNHSARRTSCIRELKAKFRMALTGTPMDGRLEELHSIMQFVAPGLLMSKVRFFQRYVETDFFGRVTGYKHLDEVSKKIQPFYLRRLIQNVMKDLPDKIYENKVVCLSTEELKIYKELAECGHEATEDQLAVVAIIRCKQFCNCPRMVDDSCKSSSKMEAFKEVIDEVIVQNGNKVIIFTQYKEMLNVIEEELKTMGIKFLRIDGDTPKKLRAEMQIMFEQDKSIDAMIGTEAMSAGLNFQSACYVINYDDNWSPSVMDQRAGRCYRHGQKKSVTVISFICNGTIEERIRGVIYSKSKISAQVLGDETEEVVLKRLGPKEIARLL